MMIDSEDLCMQNDNKIAELTKNHFEDFIESYQTRFEGNLQKYLSDYRRETEVFLNKKEEVLNEIFLDKKSESINSFESTVASKMSQELTEFHRQINHAKNSILSDIQTDQIKLLNDFTIQVKKFSNENKQTLGDYFVSEKSKFMYELGKGKEKFKRDLELVSVDVLENSLEKIHEQIGKQRELARGELDSLKIFKAKEFAQELDELLKKQNIQFRSEVDISLQYILNSFESDLKERADEISNKTQVNLQQISNDVRNEFQTFSKRRLTELHEDFEEIANDISVEVRQQTNKALNTDFENMVDQLAKEKDSFISFAGEKNKQVQADIETKANSLNEEISQRMRHLVERGIHEMKEEIEAKEKSHRESFEGALKNITGETERNFEQSVIEKIKSAEEIFTTKSTMKSDELLSSLNNEFTLFVNSKMSESQEALIEEYNKKLQLLNKEIRSEFAKCEGQSKSDFIQFAESKIKSGINEIQSRSEKVFLKLDNFLSEKEEILTEASIDLLQDAKREILREYKECHEQFMQMTEELENEQLSKIRSQSSAIIEESLSKLNRNTQGLLEKRMVESRELLSQKIQEFNDEVQKISDNFQVGIESKVSEYRKQLKTEGLSAHQSFRESLNIEVSHLLDEAQKDCQEVLSKQISKFENNSQKRASFLLGELNKKIKDLKTNFEKIQNEEENKLVNRVSLFADEYSNQKTKEIKKRAGNAINEKYEQFNAAIDRNAIQRESTFEAKLEKLSKENFSLCKKHMREAELDFSQKTSLYREQNLKVYREKTQELSRKVLEENKKSARNLLSSFNDHSKQSLESLSRGQLESFQHDVHKIYEEKINSTQRESSVIVSDAVARGTTELKEVFKKTRHAYSGEVEKEIEKFGFKLDSIAKYLTNNFQKSFKSKLTELNSLGDQELGKYQTLVKRIASETMHEMQLELKRQVQSELNSTYSQVKLVNQKMVKEVQTSAQETTQKAKQKVYNECVAEAKKVLSRLQGLSQQVYNNQLNRHKTLMSDYNKKVAYLENLLSRQNQKPVGQKQVKSSIRPPQLPTV